MRQARHLPAEILCLLPCPRQVEPPGLRLCTYVCAFVCCLMPHSKQLLPRSVSSQLAHRLRQVVTPCHYRQHHHHRHLLLPSPPLRAPLFSCRRTAARGPAFIREIHTYPILSARHGWFHWLPTVRACLLNSLPSALQSSAPLKPVPQPTPWSLYAVEDGSERY